VDDHVLQERRVRRHAATRYSAGILVWDEVSAWLKKYLPSATRQGRLQADLVVTMEAFDDSPGDDIQQFTNPLGETVYRKKLLVPGSPTAEIRLIAFEGE
jgi:hypothetical protein